MNSPGLRHRVLRGFLLFSIVQFFLLVALAIYSYHYGEDQALSRLVAQKPAVWSEYQSIDQVPQQWREHLQHLKPGSHELSGRGLKWLEGREMHVHVRTRDDDNGKTQTQWRVLQFAESDQPQGVMSVYGLFALLAIILLVAFGGWAAWLIAYRVSRPLEQLAEAVGNRNTSAASPSLAAATDNGEVALLAQTLDQAFTRVDEAMEREKTLSRNISHELRTPMTVISTSLHGLDDPDPSFRREALERAKRASGEMELLTTACLELSREADLTPAAEGTGSPLVSVTDTTKQILRESLHLIEDRAIEVDMRVDDKGRPAQASESLVRLAVGNAIRNAFIHGDAGHIQISVTERSLSVENPIKPESSSPIWKQEQDGHGIGLNILGQTCERLGWRAEFKETANNRVAVSFHFAST